MICPAVAYRNAPEHAGTYDDELALLVVHGVLHLLGMDHDDDDEAEAMEQRERELLAKLYRRRRAPTGRAPEPSARSAERSAPSPTRARRRPSTDGPLGRADVIARPPGCDDIWLLVVVVRASSSSPASWPCPRPA